MIWHQLGETTWQRIRFNQCRSCRVTTFEKGVCWADPPKLLNAMSKGGVEIQDDIIIDMWTSIKIASFFWYPLRVLWKAADLGAKWVVQEMFGLIRYRWTPCDLLNNFSVAIREGGCKRETLRMWYSRSNENYWKIRNGRLYRGDWSSCDAVAI